MTEHSTDERPEHDLQDEAAELPVTESETLIEDGTEDEAQDASTIVWKTRFVYARPSSAPWPASMVNCSIQWLSLTHHPR